MSLPASLSVDVVIAKEDVTVLNDYDVAFVISLIASFCQSFERVFLKGTHTHGRVHAGHSLQYMAPGHAASAKELDSNTSGHRTVSQV